MNKMSQATERIVPPSWKSTLEVYPNKLFASSTRRRESQHVASGDAPVLRTRHVSYGLFPVENWHENWQPIFRSPHANLCQKSG
jgi:hypothetical protein